MSKTTSSVSDASDKKKYRGASSKNTSPNAKRRNGRAKQKEMHKPKKSKRELSNRDNNKSDRRSKKELLPWLKRSRQNVK